MGRGVVYAVGRDYAWGWLEGGEGCIYVAGREGVDVRRCAKIASRRKEGGREGLVM